jgi:hypothetical protein
VEFLPPRRIGVAVGALLVILALVVGTALVIQTGQQPISFTSFVAGAIAVALGGAAAMIAYWTLGCWRMRYHLDRNRLEVRWAGNVLHLPLSDILRLVAGSALPAPTGFRGLRWPGYAVGSGTVAGLSTEVLFFSTHLRRQDLLYLITPGPVYAISVPDQRAFSGELGLRLALGPVEVFEPHAHRWVVWELPAWYDRPLLALLAVGFFANAALFAVQTALLPALPQELTVPVSPLVLSGHPAFKGDLLALPTAGLCVFLLNAVAGIALHLRERFAGYLFPTGSLLIQALLWVATFRSVA